MSDISGSSLPPDGSGARTKLGQIALTLPFVIFFLIQLAHHQMWRDEINAFGLAIASPNLSSLFHYIHYEGHPWLWYFLLWIVSRITTLAVGMKCLQALVGTGIYVMIGVFSPFRTWEKLLLFTCYFISFEYTVMTRMYGVLVLLALIYIRRRALHPGRVYGNAALLGLMACTDLSGMVVSFALLLEYAFAAYREWRGEGSFAAAENGVTPALLPAANRSRKLIGAFGIYAALGLSAVLSLIPAKDISQSSTSELFKVAGSGTQLGKVVVSYIVKPYFPTFTDRPGHYWIPSTAGHKLFFSLCVPVVLAAYWFVLHRRKSLLVLVGTTCLLTMSIGQFIYYGSIRHFGMTFVAFLLSLWLLRSAGDRVRWPAFALLAMTALGGVQMAYGAWQRPFSQEQNAAKWMVAHHLEDGPIAAHQGMGAWFRRPIYMLECGCEEEFLLFKRGSAYHGFNMDEMFGAARYASGRTFTYIGIEPLTSEETKTMQDHGLAVLPLAAFESSEVDNEDVYLYAISPRHEP